MAKAVFFTFPIAAVSSSLRSVRELVALGAGVTCDLAVVVMNVTLATFVMKRRIADERFRDSVLEHF